MDNNNVITLNQMASGMSGIVEQISGGHGLQRRLEALGIRPGCEITKISSLFLRGPVTLKAGSTHIAVGYGMANKILVHVNGSANKKSEIIS